MKRTLLAAAVAFSLFGLAGCQDKDAAQVAIKLDTPIQKASYGIGRDMGENLLASGLTDIDTYALAQGMRDALDGLGSAVSDEEMQQAFAELQQVAMQQMDSRSSALRESNAAWLAENAKQEGVTTTESGLQYKVLKAADEDAMRPTSSDLVKVHYEGRLIDGTVFDSSRQRGQPAVFPVDGVIDGWVEALQLMKVGEQWSVTIPSELAYGPDSPAPSIPPHSVLVFDMELLEVVSPDSLGQHDGH